MKKIISAITAVILTASSVLPFVSSAEDYMPLFYMKMQDSEDIKIEEDGTVVISREAAGKKLVLTAGIYFQDETESAWSVSPRWNSSSKFITLEKAYDPTDPDDLRPYAYAETNANRDIISGVNETEPPSVNAKFNSINFTCRKPNGKPLVKYGSTTDEYPLITFDMSVDMNIPYGEYEICFLREENACRAAMALENRPIYAPPRTENLRIRVEGINIGDVNNDGAINSIDASAILCAYANSLTGGEYGFTSEQTEAADVNLDGTIDSKDATDILLYYAYTITTSGDFKGLTEYFGR